MAITDLLAEAVSEKPLQPASTPLIHDIPVDATNAATAGLREGHAWAIDAFWAYENLGEKMTRQKAGTSARWAQWQSARKDTGYFLMQILPKAMQLLERARDKGADADMVEREERKEIAKMQRVLKEAIKEAIGLNG